MSKIFTSSVIMRELSRELPSEPENHGMVWTTAMKTDLARDFCKLYNLRALCIRYGRTPDSIVAKLRDLNLLTYSVEDSTYRYNIPVKQQPDNQPETQLENDMTQPLNTVTFLFGTDIKECTTDKLIKAIQTCQSEIATHKALPLNKFSVKRVEECKTAIEAAVAELDTRA